MNTTLRLQYDMQIKEMHKAKSYMSHADQILNKPFSIKSPLQREQRARVLTGYCTAKDRWESANADIQQLEKLFNLKTTQVDPDWMHK